MAQPKRQAHAYLEGDAATLQCVGYIGAQSTDDETGTYWGPIARVSFDKDWLYIVTDDYEGSAMINIQALGKLRLALARIHKERRRQQLQPTAHEARQP